MTAITIDASLCDNCNLCLAACRHGGLGLKDGQVVPMAAADCRECRTCEFICDRGAIDWSYEIMLAEVKKTD